MNILYGDFRFFWPESIKDFAAIPSAWDSSLNTGLGIPALNSLWITSYFNFTAFFTKFGLGWNQIQVVFWILPAIILSFLSSYLLFNYLFPDKKNYAALSGMVYLLNTYFLMVLTGGQLGVSLAYSLVPLAFLAFINVVQKINLKNSIIFSLVLSLELLLDPRFLLLTLVLLLLYYLLQSEFRKKHILYVVLAPLLITFLLHSYWIIPLILFKPAFLPPGFDSLSGLKFFSFALFENTISLLHPNWPENIFGKTYFMRPEFLLIPIFAFGSLLLIDIKRKKEILRNRFILFFAFLGLVGAFLAKGSNEPFGWVFEWLFGLIPGFSFFRDPTKFYFLIAFSYSILIPFSLKEITRFFKFAPLLFGLYFLFLIGPIFGQIKTQQVPQEYVQLKDFLIKEKIFSRTLWVPQWQRFGYFSNNHPAIGREELFKGGTEKQIGELKKESSEEKLKNLGVKYVIVPYDSGGEIFLNDRKYDEDQYEKTISELREIAWLKELPLFDKIRLFEVGDPKDRFWSPSTALRIEYGSIKPTEYSVRVKNAKEGDMLIFSDGFDKNWTLENSEYKVKSSEFNKLNSFRLSKGGDYELRVYYEPQKHIEAGLLLSVATIVILLVLLKLPKLLRRI